MTLFKYHQTVAFLAIASLSASVMAASLNANLTVQLELERACKINNKLPNQGDVTNLGELNFGEMPSHFSGTLTTSLSNPFNGIQIQCSETTPVDITFNEGLHANHVPAAFQAAYYWAMGHGNGNYVAYNIINNHTSSILKPNESFAVTGSTTAQTYGFTGMAAHDGSALAIGDYSDTVSVSIVF